MPEKFQKMKDHEEVAKEAELKKHDPDSPTAPHDPLYEDLKKREKEILERAKQTDKPLTDVGQAAARGIQSQGDREIVVDGKRIMPHSDYVKKVEAEKHDPDSPTAPHDPLYEDLKKREKEMAEKVKRSSKNQEGKTEE